MVAACGSGPGEGCVYYAGRMIAAWRANHTTFG